MLHVTHQVVTGVQTQPTGHAMQQATYGAPGTPAPAHSTVPAVQRQTHIVFGAAVPGVQQGSQVPPVQPHPVHTNFQNQDGMQTFSYGYNYGNTTAMPPVDYYSSTSSVRNQLAKVTQSENKSYDDRQNFAHSEPGLQLTDAFNKTQAALAASDGDDTKSSDPIAGHD